jgi:hypothetical protein
MEMKNSLLIVLVATLSVTSESFAGANPATISCNQDQIWVQGTIPGDSSNIKLTVEANGTNVIFIDEFTQKQLSQDEKLELKGKEIILSSEKECSAPKRSYYCEIRANQDSQSWMKIKSIPKTLSENRSNGMIDVYFDAEIIVKSQKFKKGQIQVKKARCVWKYHEP